MKSLSVLVVGLTISSMVNAIEIAGWERPIMGASLTYLAPTKPQVGAKATYMTLNQQDESVKPTSFTMVEDTGIRCIQAPCPSTREVEFKITAIIPALHSDAVRYEAIEVLKNIPANVRIARRQLFVTESSMELVDPHGQGFSRKTVWEVEVQRVTGESMMYYGNPEALASIQSE